MIVLQKQIAEKAGVSYATVSRAFTNSAKVKAQTMQQIRNAMSELGITNSDDILMGRGFVCHTVLVVVSDISNHFYCRVVKGICEELSAHGYTALLCNSGVDESRELESVRDAADSGLCGIILVTVTETEEMIRFLQTSPVPVVLVNRYIQALDLDVVRIDNYRGGYMAAQYFLDHGHREIAVLAGMKSSGTTRDRVKGFRDGVKNCGASFLEEDIVYGDNTRESGRDFADWLVTRPKRYTAAFIGNDYMAVGAARRLAKLGVELPEAYSLICFDDSPLIDEDGLNLTSISSDPILMGRSAASTFLKRRSDLLGDRFKIIYSPVLRERGSVLNRSKTDLPEPPRSRTNSSGG